MRPPGQGRRRPSADRADPRRGVGRDDAPPVGRQPPARHRRTPGARAAELAAARPGRPRTPVADRRASPRWTGSRSPRRTCAPCSPRSTPSAPAACRPPPAARCTWICSAAAAACSPPSPAGNSSRRCAAAARSTPTGTAGARSCTGPRRPRAMHPPPPSAGGVAPVTTAAATPAVATGPAGSDLDHVVPHAEGGADRLRQPVLPVSPASPAQDPCAPAGASTSTPTAPCWSPPPAVSPGSAAHRAATSWSRSSWVLHCPMPSSIDVAPF